MKKTISIFIAFIFVLICFDTGTFKALAETDKDDILLDAETVYDEVFTGKTSIAVNFRIGPGTEYECIVDSNGEVFKLPAKQKLTVLGNSHDTEGNVWYQVSLTYKKTKYTGFIFGQYVKIDLKDEPLDDEFEEYLFEQGFPDSYKPYLRHLHLLYPDWQFVAVHTGLTWKEALKGECNVPNREIKNTICAEDYPNYNWRSTKVRYNKQKNVWIPCDGSDWYAASDEVVAYYMDPRSYLDEMHIYAFESLSYIKKIHSKSGVNAILSGTFMSKKHKAYGDDRTYADIIMAAAKKTGVSPYHIASRIRQEMGVRPNAAAKGTYNGCFNYFNIGALDGGNALVAGLKYAAKKGSYGRPWNTVYKSILGGARFLAAGYIGAGQNTLYTQKFNIIDKEDLFDHQYCTNVQMPYEEAVTTYAAYYKMGSLKSGFVFDIPVYDKLPENAVELPSSEGNPNNYLSSLTVKGYDLTPAFKLGNRVDYSITVSENVGSVNISCAAAYRKSKIIGGGKIKLKKGTNVIYIYVKSQSKSERKYTITIVRGSVTEKITYHDPKQK